MTGQRISHFEVLEKLGEGGMGVVYKARDLDLNRLVALKMLPAAVSGDAERRQRFLQEAQAASALNHPGIVTVYEIFREGGNEFIAMEYLDGKTLGELIGPKGMKLVEALRLGEQIAGALGAAHGAGIVHRDLKPANVMVTGLGQAKILDFGLAKLTEAGPGDTTVTSARPQTEAGTILGTLAYMSPEQAEGNPVDWRSDIFSFGTLLYEMVTGRKAFGAEGRLLTLTSVMEKEPEPMGEAVPRELQRLVARLMKKKPAERSQSMVDVKHALEELRSEIASGQMSGVHAAGPVKAGARWPLAAGLAVAVVAVVAAGIWMMKGRKTEAVLYKPVPFTSYPGLEEDPALSPDGNFVAFAWNGPGQDNFDIYVRRVGSGEPLRLTQNPETDRYPAWSRNGDFLAFVRTGPPENRGIFVIPALGGTERRVARIGTNSKLTWTPDGKGLVAGAVHYLALVQVETGETTRLALPLERKSHYHLEDPAFSPDGKELAFLVNDSVEGHGLFVVGWSAEGKMDGSPRQVRTGRFNGLSSFSWSGDGKSLFVVDEQGGTPQIFRVSAAGGGEPELLAGLAERPDSVTAGNGRMVYGTLGQNADLWKMDIGPDSRTGPEAAFLQSTRREDIPIFSPDGKEVLFRSDRSGALELWLVNRDGSNLRQLTRMAPVRDRAFWKSDSSEILFGAIPKGRAVFRIRREGGAARQVGPPGALSARWTADGKAIDYSFAPIGAGDLYHLYRMGAEDTGEGVQLAGTEFYRDASLFAVSRDGKYEWTPKLRAGPDDDQGLIRKDLTNGTKLVVAGKNGFTDYYFAHDGIYFVEAGSQMLRFCSYEDTRAVDVTRLPEGVLQPRAGTAAGKQFAVSPDRKMIVYVKQAPVVRDLYLVEGVK